MPAQRPRKRPEKRGGNVGPDFFYNRCLLLEHKNIRIDKDVNPVREVKYVTGKQHLALIHIQRCIIVDMMMPDDPGNLLERAE